ncbi:MAG: M48 family metalloprotease [Alphaproteobacteria bacterium]|nr:M48 family metalloprotease [Alphaproteobacteria bacterium]
MKRLSPFIAAVALAACASTPTTPPVTQSPPPAAASVTEGLERYIEQRARVEAVAFRLRRAAAPDCARKGQTKPDLGLVVWSLANFTNPQDREKLSQSFNLTNAVTVALAVEGAPAANAGLREGTVVTAVNGQTLGEGKGATERFIALSSAAAKQGPVRVTVAGRNEITMSPESLCEFPTLLVRSPEINAAADGSVLAITSGLYDLTRTDDERALILGHELAHNVLGHVAKVSQAKPGGILDAFVKATIGTAVAAAVNRPYSIAFEKEADRVGLYFMARAGYDIDAAESFWKRLNATTRASAVNATHPSGPERLKAIQATIAEIKVKQKAGLPLTPRR